MVWYIDVNISKVGCVKYDYGRYGLFKAVLPRTAKVTCLPPITYSVGTPAILKHTSLLSSQGQWLPFDFDGKTFKARNEPYNSEAPFTRAFLALFGNATRNHHPALFTFHLIHSLICSRRLADHRIITSRASYRNHV